VKEWYRASISEVNTVLTHLKYIVHPIYVANLWKKGGASEKRHVMKNFVIMLKEGIE
jgi:hypothetical protein